MPLRHLYCWMKDCKILYVFAVKFFYVLHSIYVLESKRFAFSEIRDVFEGRGSK